MDVGRFRYVGLAADDVLRLSDLTLPAGGLLVVENLTPFEACLALPAAGRARLVLWCDADMGGVRIARDLTAQPDAFLSDTLQAILKRGAATASS